MATDELKLLKLNNKVVISENNCCDFSCPNSAHQLEVSNTLFVDKLNSQIDDKSDEFMVELEELRQVGYVKAYYEQFVRVTNSMQLLDDGYMIYLFVFGLSEENRSFVNMFDPKTLDDAYSLAKLQEFTLSKSESSSRVDKVELVNEKERVETIEENEAYKVSDEMPKRQFEGEITVQRENDYKLISTNEIWNGVKEFGLFGNVEKLEIYLDDSEEQKDELKVNEKGEDNLKFQMHDTVVEEYNSGSDALFNHKNILQLRASSKPMWTGQLEYSYSHYLMSAYVGWIPPKPPDHIGKSCGHFLALFGHEILIQIKYLGWVINDIHYSHLKVNFTYEPQGTSRKLFTANEDKKKDKCAVRCEQRATTNSIELHLLKGKARECNRSKSELHSIWLLNIDSSFECLTTMQFMGSDVSDMVATKGIAEILMVLSFPNKRHIQQHKHLQRKCLIATRSFMETYQVATWLKQCLDTALCKLGAGQIDGLKVLLHEVANGIYREKQYSKELVVLLMYDSLEISQKGRHASEFITSQKHSPEVVVTWKERLKSMLIKGLFDTNGSISHEKCNNDLNVFSQSGQQLLQAFSSIAVFSFLLEAKHSDRVGHVDIWIFINTNLGVLVLSRPLGNKLVMDSVLMKVISWCFLWVSFSPIAPFIAYLNLGRGGYKTLNDVSRGGSAGECSGAKRSPWEAVEDLQISELNVWVNSHP